MTGQPQSFELHTLTKVAHSTFRLRLAPRPLGPMYSFCGLADTRGRLYHKELRTCKHMSVMSAGANVAHFLG